jgi:hypothetical protein
LTSTRWLSWPAPNCSTPCFSLEPAGQAAHHRIGAGGDRNEQHLGRSPASAAGNRRAARPAAAARPFRDHRRTLFASCRTALTKGPERAPVVELDRVRLDQALFHAPRERVRGADAPTVRVVEGEGKTQPLRPLAQGRSLGFEGRIGAGQGALDQVAPGLEPVVGRRLVQLPLAIDVPLDQEARSEGEQQQHRHHGGVDAEVKALHSAGVSSASCLRANT